MRMQSLTLLLSFFCSYFIPHTTHQKCCTPLFPVCIPIPNFFSSLFPLSIYQLVLMTPKSLLRHPRARSHLADMAPGSRFQRLIPEIDRNIFSKSGVPNPSVSRLVLCSGKIYYELLEAREKLGEHGVAIARVEQISPFPFDLVQQHADVCWTEEGPIM